MLKTFVILCTSCLCLVLADVKAEVTPNDILLSDTGNNLTELELVSNSKLPYVYHDVGEKKVVSIVVNPIIHNVAQGYGPGAGLGDKTVGTSTTAPVTTTITTTMAPDNLFVASVSVFFRKIRFFIQFIIKGAASLLRGIIRFVLCTFIPICGLFSVFGDEPVDESLVTPEGVARGLDFLEGFIEKYNSLENSTLL